MAFMQVTSNLDMFSIQQTTVARENRFTPTNLYISYTLNGVIIQSIPRRWRKKPKAFSTGYISGTASTAVKKRLGCKKPPMSVKSSQYIQQHILQCRV